MRGCCDRAQHAAAAKRWPGPTVVGPYADMVKLFGAEVVAEHGRLVTFDDENGLQDAGPAPLAFSPPTIAQDASAAPDGHVGSLNGGQAVLGPASEPDRD